LYGIPIADRTEETSRATVHPKAVQVAGEPRRSPPRSLRKSGTCRGVRAKQAAMAPRCKPLLQGSFAGLGRKTSIECQRNMRKSATGHLPTCSELLLVVLLPLAATLVTLSKCRGLNQGRSDLFCGQPCTDPAFDVLHDHVLVDVVEKVVKAALVEL
jgi:hypothetical protein